MPVPAQREVHRRTLLRDNVYGSLRDAIVSGQFAPGEQLRDAELSTWLGVSRTPIREALLRLSRAGLVNATPGRLTVVAPEDPQRVMWAREIAVELQSLAVRLAAGKLTEAQFDALTEANDAVRAALAEKNLVALHAADEDFHTVLIKAAGNPLIEEQLEMVMLLLRREEHLHPDLTKGAQWAEHHESMLVALRDGDVDRAVVIARAGWRQAPDDDTISSTS